MSKIIVADDEPNHLELVRTILERAGHDVVAVESCQKCLWYLADHDIDLVITDIFMPDFNGLQLLAAIRAEGREVPVIGMTGGMHGQTVPFTEIMARLGARQVLTKPFPGSYLLDAVQSAMEK